MKKFLIIIGILIIGGVLVAPAVAKGIEIIGMKCGTDFAGNKECRSALITAHPGGEGWGLVWPKIVFVESDDYCEINPYGVSGDTFCSGGIFGLGSDCPTTGNACLPACAPFDCPECYDPFNIYGKIESCPSTVDYTGKFSSDPNGQSCRVAIDDAWDWFHNPQMWGAWDASEDQCVVCNGKVEDSILGDKTEIKKTILAGFLEDDEVFTCDQDSDGVCENPNGDGLCESACGADAVCDEVPAGMKISVAGGECNDCVFTSAVHKVCQDDKCVTVPGAGPPGPPECTVHADCAEAPPPPGVEDCDNGEDDDGDGLVDCADVADCAADPACLPPPPPTGYMSWKYGFCNKSAWGGDYISCATNAKGKCSDLTGNMCVPGVEPVCAGAAGGGGAGKLKINFAGNYLCGDINCCYCNSGYTLSSDCECCCSCRNCSAVTACDSTDCTPQSCADLPWKSGTYCIDHFCILNPQPAVSNQCATAAEACGLCCKDIYCGDGEVDAPWEDCEVDADCAPGEECVDCDCKATPVCGDGAVTNPPEDCDLSVAGCAAGVGNCVPDCAAVQECIDCECVDAASCDGVVKDPWEECDVGVAGCAAGVGNCSYCAADEECISCVCVPGGACGDGTKNAWEDCDLSVAGCNPGVDNCPDCGVGEECIDCMCRLGASSLPLCLWVSKDCGDVFGSGCNDFQRTWRCEAPDGTLNCSGGCAPGATFCIPDNTCLLTAEGCECAPDTCCANEYCVEENCTATNPDPDCAFPPDLNPVCDLKLNLFSKGEYEETDEIEFNLGEGENTTYIILPMGSEVCDTNLGIKYEGPPLSSSTSPLADNPFPISLGGKYVLFAPSGPAHTTSGLNTGVPPGLYDSSAFTGDLINFGCPLEMLLENCNCPGCSLVIGEKWGLEYCKIRIGLGISSGKVTLSLKGPNHFIEYKEPPLPLFPGGLVLCGRHFDDPTTNIDESMPCTLCHSFMTTKRIIDFALLKILLPLIFASAVIGGGVLILAGGSSKKIAAGKAILLITGRGVIIAFGGWLIIETLVVAFTPNAVPWRAWDTIVCPVAPCDEVDSAIDDDICNTAVGALTPEDKIPIGEGEDAQTCPHDCAYNLLKGKNTEDVNWAADVWPTSPNLRGCDFDGVCEDAEKIDNPPDGGSPESCPDCAVCGDGVVDIGEECDGSAFRQILTDKIAEFGGTQTCEVFVGYSGGTFNCTSSCKINMEKCEQK